MSHILCSRWYLCRDTGYRQRIVPLIAPPSAYRKARCPTLCPMQYSPTVYSANVHKTAFGTIGGSSSRLVFFLPVFVLVFFRICSQQSATQHRPKKRCALLATTRMRHVHGQRRRHRHHHHRHRHHRHHRTQRPDIRPAVSLPCVCGPHGIAQNSIKLPIANRAENAPNKGTFNVRHVYRSGGGSMFVYL